MGVQKGVNMGIQKGVQMECKTGSDGVQTRGTTFCTDPFLNSGLPLLSFIGCQN